MWSSIVLPMRGFGRLMTQLWSPIVLHMCGFGRRVSHLVDLVMGAAVPLGYKYDSVVVLGFPSSPLASQQICLRSSKDISLDTLQSPTL